MKKRLLIIGMILLANICVVFAQTKPIGEIRIYFSALYPAQTASRAEWYDASKIYSEYIWTQDSGRRAYTGWTTSTGSVLEREDPTTDIISGTDIWVANLYEYKDARFLGAGTLVKENIGYNEVLTLRNYDGVKLYYKVVWHLNPKLNKTNNTIYEKNLVCSFKAYRLEIMGAHSVIYDYGFDNKGNVESINATNTNPCTIASNYEDLGL